MRLPGCAFFVAEAFAAAGMFGPVVAALVHIAGVVAIAVNSVRLAGGTYRAPAAASEEPLDAAPPKNEKESFVLPKLTPLQSV